MTTELTITDIESKLDLLEFPEALQSVTIITLPFSAAVAWKKVCFYEHIKLQPSLVLRTVLPVPRRTSGCHGKVGDTSRCIYSDGGYLTKRMIRIEEGELLAFEIVEQTIRYHSFVRLLGGSIRVTPLCASSCQIEMLTNFQSRLRPRWLFNYFVNKVVKAMHHIVFNDMQIECARLVEESQSPDGVNQVSVE